MVFKSCCYQWWWLAHRRAKYLDLLYYSTCKDEIIRICEIFNHIFINVIYFGVANLINLFFFLFMYFVPDPRRGVIIMTTDSSDLCRKPVPLIKPCESVVFWTFMGPTYDDLYSTSDRHLYGLNRCHVKPWIPTNLCRT